MLNEYKNEMHVLKKNNELEVQSFKQEIKEYENQIATK